MDCNGDDDAPGDNLNERPTDLETPVKEQNNEADMDGCLQRSCQKQLVVRRLTGCAHAASLRALHFYALHWILCSLNDAKGRMVQLEYRKYDLVSN